MKRRRLLIILMLFLFLAMGNAPVPSAYCMGKKRGDPCLYGGGYAGCQGKRATCQPDTTEGLHDLPDTAQDESLICMESNPQPQSPVSPDSPVQP